VPTVPRTVVASWLALSVLLAGCAEAAVVHRQPEAVDDGVQVTGTLGGARVAISEGVPDVTFGDCDPGIEIDEDVCWSARTIDGLTVGMVIENPAVLRAGEEVEVVDVACDLDCDQVTDGVVVEVRWDGQRARAVGGRLEVSEVGERVAADVDLRLPASDRLTGSFNVRELRPEELDGSA
jgi:hypothetical protein